MIKKRKLKVANKRKFLTFITISLIISFIAISSLFFQSAVECEVENRYINVYVKNGDTLWDIASKHNVYGKDIRELVQVIRKENQLSTLFVFPGQSLRIPLK